MESKKPDIVGLAFSFYINITKLVDMVREIKKRFPSQKFILGGRAELKEQSYILTKFNDVFYFNTIVGLNEFLIKESARSS